MLVNSKHEKLGVKEIVTFSASEYGGRLSPEQALAAVIVEVHQGGAYAIKEGNTLFLVHKAPENPKIGVFKIINADTEKNCFENAIVFVKLARTSFDTIVSIVDNKLVEDVFNYIENNPPFPDMSCDVVEEEEENRRLGIINFKSEEL